MDFIGKRDGGNVFEYECSHCGAAGEVTVAKDNRKVFGHGCGALFIQQPATGMFGKPQLVEVNPKLEAA